MFTHHRRSTPDFADIVERVRQWAAEQITRWTPHISEPGHELTGVVEQNAVAALAAVSPQRRWEAAALLGKNPQRGTETIQALMAALSDPEPFVRWQAAEALARQDTAHVFPALSAGLTDASPLCRAGVAEALGRLGGEAACQALRGALADPDSGVRAAAASALGASNDVTSVSSLLPRLADPTPDVRIAAARALGRIGDVGAAAPLAAALTQPRQPLLVRRALAAALARVPHPEVQPALLAALEDPDAQVRGYAAQALGQVGNEAAWTALQAIQGDNSPLLRGTVNGAARQALALLERRGRQAPTVAVRD
jgi:HEAT repeat protein